MDLSQWIENVRQQTSRLRQRLIGLAQEAGQAAGKIIPNTLYYGTTASLSVLPLIAALQNGVFPYVELTQLFGNVGVNLLSSELHAWKNRSQPDAYEPLAVRLNELAEQKEEWRTLLDKLIEQMQAVASIKSELDEQSAGHFLSALQQDAKRLGSKLIVAGNIKYANLGDGTLTVYETHVLIEKIVNFYQRPDDTLQKADLKKQINAYLAWIIDSYGKIVMRGVEYQGRNVINLDLDQIYVPLQAQTTKTAAQKKHKTTHSAKLSGGHDEQQSIDIRLDQLLPLAPKLIVTGGPGSGKTTVLQHIAWSLAAALTRDPEIARQKLGLSAADPGASNLPLPIYLPLSRYHSYRRKLQENGRVDAPHTVTLYHFLSHFLIERSTTVPRLPPDFFVRLLETEQALILLLDGLDEVPNDTERAQICEVIEDLVA
ncbi:MAG: NACHT domain-containing protein, partial [Caldilinea sp.]